MSKYMKKNEKQNKKRYSTSDKDILYLNNLIGSRKIIKETNAFIQELYTHSKKFAIRSKHSTDEIDYEVNRALSMYAETIADLLDARFDRYRIV